MGKVLSNHHHLTTTPIAERNHLFRADAPASFKRRIPMLMKTAIENQTRNLARATARAEGSKKLFQSGFRQVLILSFAVGSFSIALARAILSPRVCFAYQLLQRPLGK
jgi:hypothetical protein